MMENKRLKYWHIPLLVFLIIGTIYIGRTEGNLFGGAAKSGEGARWQRNEIQRVEGGIFGTFYHITYQSDISLQSGIDSTLAAVNMSLSPFEKKSTITALNNSQSIKADSMLVDVLAMAREVSDDTDGAFDVTVAPLVNLWGFGFKNMKEVSEERVDSLLKFVDYRTVSIQGDTIAKLHSQTMIDCSAIAKGYGVDAVGKYLESHGISNYMVEIGGELRLRGFNPTGNKWTVGITKPNDDVACTQSELEEVLSTTDISMATSGNYRNYYIKDGRKYAHTIDPHTGHPVQHSILSATVLASECAIADAYATSFMVLGIECAKEVLVRHPEMMAYLIYEDEGGEMKVWYTDNLKDKIGQK